MRLVRTAVPEAGLAITISQCLTGNTRGGVSWLQPFIRRAQRPITLAPLKEFQECSTRSHFVSESLLTGPKSSSPASWSLFVTALRAPPLSPS